jgi:glycerol-3-phosphate O-acyltransferase/dihydroxyacetone phosphate acyltransferase
MGYERYKDDPRVIELRRAVTSYNKRLLALGIRDHQVQSYAKIPLWKIFGMFWYRVIKLLCLSILVLPGTLLFSLVFIFTKLISIRKAKEALAASNVKVHARDVMATWKLLVAMVVAPLSYGFHVSWFTTLYWYNNCFGYVPPGIPLKALIIAQILIYPTLTYAALRFGEVGMDIGKSLWPLMNMMVPTSNNEIVKLQIRREELTEQVNNLINTLGPEMFEDFDAKRIISDPFAVTTPPATPGGTRRKSGDYTPASPDVERPTSSHLPRNESFHDISNQDFFSTRPPTPKKSRSRTSSIGGFQLKAFSTIDSKDTLDEVSKKIRGAMRDRGRRRSSGVGLGADGPGYESGTTTPGGSEDGVGEGLMMTKKDR